MKRYAIGTVMAAVIVALGAGLSPQSRALAAATGAGRGHLSQSSITMHRPHFFRTRRASRAASSTAPVPLQYYGGPVMHASHTYAIFWLPSGYSFESTGGSDSSYESLISKYFQDIGGSSRYNILSQYYDVASGSTAHNNIANSSSLAASYVDTTDFPANGCTDTLPDGSTTTVCLTQQQIMDEVVNAINTKNWTYDSTTLFFVFTPLDVGSCGDSTNQDCGFTQYCAYHSAFTITDPNTNQSQSAMFANMPDNGIDLTHCGPHDALGKSLSPNGDPAADAEISTTSHEHFEAVSDPLPSDDSSGNPTSPTGWIDPANQEIGDKCAYTYGTLNPDGSNAVLNGHPYIMQEEWSNASLSCVQSYASLSVAIKSGWNLIDVPVPGVTSAGALLSIMNATGQLGAHAVTLASTYANGHFNLYVPGFSPQLTLAPAQGVFIYSTAAGNWTPTGSIYPTGQAVSLQPGWNLVAAPSPSGGLEASRIASEASGCNVQEVAMRSGGTYATWTPGGTDFTIPATSGFWIQCSSASIWTPS